MSKPSKEQIQQPSQQAINQFNGVQEIEEFELKSTKTDKTQIDILIESGIPLKMAVFHRPIKSIMGEPEFAFYVKETDPKKVSPKPSRIAKMWYTPHGLVTLQKDQFKLIPLANVSETIVL